MTGVGGELHSAILRRIVSHALGVYSEHARVVRISSTLSRDTTLNHIVRLEEAHGGQQKRISSDLVVHF